MEIQIEVKALRQAKPTSDAAKPDEISLPQRLTTVTQQLKKAKVWDDPRKKKKAGKVINRTWFPAH